MSLPRTRRRVVEGFAKKPPVELRSVRVVFEEDPEPDAMYLEHEDFAARHREYRNGEFTFWRVHAEADVVIADTPQILSSSGLGSIESDTLAPTAEAGADRFAEFNRVIHEEWNILRVVLKTIGVPTTHLPLEANHEWIEWRT